MRDVTGDMGSEEQQENVAVRLEGLEVGALTQRHTQHEKISIMQPRLKQQQKPRMGRIICSYFKATFQICLTLFSNRPTPTSSAFDARWDLYSFSVDQNKR